MTAVADTPSIAGLVPSAWQGAPQPDGPRGSRLWWAATAHATASRAEAVRLAYTAQLLPSRSTYYTVVLPGGIVITTARIAAVEVQDGPKATATGGLVRLRWRLVLPDGWATQVRA